MANETRRRYDFFSGTVTDNPLGAGAGTLNSAELSAFPTVPAAEYVVIIFDPLGPDPEIAYMTAHTSGQTTGTILRGREGTTGQEWAAGTDWVHGPTVTDFDYLRTPMSRLYARANYR